MGCCCSSRRTQRDATPVYAYCSQTLGNQPLSSANGTSSSVSAGMLVDTNLDTSIPDTYRAPPAPLPYDVGFPRSQTQPASLENFGNKAHPTQPADLQPPGEALNVGACEGLDASEDLKGTDCKNKTDEEHDSVKVIEDDPKKVCTPVSPVVDEEDVCPICLEEYDSENPRIITKCEHHFHLACILEWNERSDTCPVCDQMMMFDQNFYE